MFNLPLAQAIGATEKHPADLDDLETSSNFPSTWDAEDRGLSVEINWDLGNVTLTSITGYRDYEDVTIKDNDFGGVDILLADQRLPEISLLSEEFRFHGLLEDLPFGQSLDWTLGIYYATEDIEYTNEFIWASQITSFPRFPPFLPPGFFGGQPGRAFLASFKHEDETFAVFAHGTLEVTEKLALTGGFRWTRDEKEASLVNDHPTNNVGFLGLGFPPFNFNSFPLPVVHDYTAETENEEPTGTASIQYNWTDNVMTFFTYSHGFKAGGLSLARDAAGPFIALGSPAGCPPGGAPIGPVCNFAVPGDPAFRPEFADHYEIGVKSTLLSDRLRLNVAAWRTDFEDLQLQTLQPAGNFAVENIAGARSQGVEAEGNLLVTNELQINFSVQWLDATFDKGIGALTPGPGFIPLGGENLPFSSEWTGTVGAIFEQPLADTGWELFLGGNVFFRSEQYNFTEPRYDRKLGGLELLNLHGGIRSTDGRWEVKGWCRNCADKRYTWTQFQIPFDGAMLLHRRHCDPPILKAFCSGGVSPMRQAPQTIRLWGFCASVMSIREGVPASGSSLPANAE